jgi:hypothetical protein
MATHYTVLSHGKVLGPAFEFVEPIIAELTAPPAIKLVEEVIPTQDEYLHSCRDGSPACLDELVCEAARLHHFRGVLERYEGLALELRDSSGRRVDTTTLTIAKQMVPADAVREYVEETDPAEAQWVDVAEPCYLIMARLMATTSAASAA